MIKIMNFTMPVQYTQEQLYQKIAERLQIKRTDILQVEYLKKSIDARKKPQIFIVSTLLVKVKQEAAVLKCAKKDANIQTYMPYHYIEPICKHIPKERPVVIGFGPAGMFAALLLAKAGLCPLVLERGSCVEDRQRDVAIFRETGKLCLESNIQFGEGGAGTFSDGKLTTGIKDPRIRYVLETFVAHGAPEEILYVAKPHIGTDRLVTIVRKMRDEIQKLGGEIQFRAKCIDLEYFNGQLTSISYQKNGRIHKIAASHCILAIGHSSRDTLSMLYQRGIHLEQKNFAVGLRIEHLQSWLNNAMYGKNSCFSDLPSADYKLAVHLPNGRSLYTFCMCPGGEVVAAASERNRLVTNGMSNYSRDGRNANSALLIGISKSELQDTHPFAGIRFQQKLEESAFLTGGGNYNAPVCCVGDFLNDRTPKALGSVEPTYRPGVTFASPKLYLPDFVTDTLKLGIIEMDKKIHGFAMPDAVLTGVESRSSSPIRITRDSDCKSVSVKGLYPCGEGAGYAGGITSASIDGMRCAENLIQSIK